MAALDASGDAPATDAESSITITKRTDRSVYMFLLQHMIKPFNTLLIKPRKTFPAGSQKLTPPKKTSVLFDVRERRVEDVYIYDFVPRRLPPFRQPAEKSKRKRLYYFGGGGWQMPPSSEHWAFCTEMAKELPDIAVSLVSYPLSPHSPAPLAFPQLLRMYQRLLREAEEAGERLILGGDSSGGNLILSLCLESLAQDDTAPRPSALMAICASTDCRKINPDMENTQKHDPILRISFVKSTATAWRGEWSASDRRVTPLLADVSLLAKKGVACHGVVANYDILGPDAVLFRNKCQEAKVHGEWLDWDKQMHVFPLAFKYRLPESVQGKDWILDVLRRC